MADKYKNHSKEFDDVLNSHPSFIVRYGIFFLFTIVLFLIVISCFVKYSEVIMVPIKLVDLEDSSYDETSCITLIGEADVRMECAKKIKVGQAVIMNIDNGISVREDVVGYVNRIYVSSKSIDENNHINLIIHFPDASNKLSDYLVGRTVQADVFISTHSLATKIFDPIKNIIK